jgi:hypothetical protein
MAKQRWEDENLDQFAAAIMRMAERVNRVDKLGQEKHPNALSQIALIAGTAFHKVAQQQSPYLTGLLRKEHVLSDVEVSTVRGGMQAQTRIYINPDPTLENELMGGFPGQYGPEYHMERRQWFAEAEQIVDPLFGKILDDQLEIYFDGFWSYWE